MPFPRGSAGWRFDAMRRAVHDHLPAPLAEHVLEVLDAGELLEEDFTSDGARTRQAESNGKLRLDVACERLADVWRRWGA